MLSIRKVLFHELAHNVHSDHDGKFFKLMRQIEKECNELDWTRDGHRSGGLSTSADSSYNGETDDYSVLGGTYVLGSKNNSTLLTNNSQGMSKRELLARATEMRLTEEEMQIQDACGCFENLTVVSESRTDAMDVEDDQIG